MLSSTACQKVIAMESTEKKGLAWNSPNSLLLFALLAGGIAGWFQPPFIVEMASVLSNLFISLLRLVSLPIIFCSVVATASGMSSGAEARQLGGRTLCYTLLTTVLAATVALLLFLSIDPVQSGLREITGGSLPAVVGEGHGYLAYLVQVVPSNVIKPFAENNVVGVLILALFLSAATLSLPVENKKVLHSFFQSLFMAIMKMTGWIVKAMPLAVFSFVILFMKDLRQGIELHSLALYLVCVVAANLVQALVVLPIFLKVKGLSPWHMFKGMFPALSVAFFSKSSGAALPMAMRCAIENVGVDRKVAHFSLPLCTTMNMNGCAAFILTTVLFVSMSHGVTYQPIELPMWIVIATIAAVGNAGVPMGCYFLSSAILAAMGVPLEILGVILPFYTFIDMIETAINVWSDACVTAVVGRDLAGSTLLAPEEARALSSSASS